MAGLVITRFSLDDVRRLNSLPIVERPQEGPMTVDEAREVASRGWLPMSIKRWPEPTMWDECVGRCSVAFHYHDGRWYYRHGAEALCALVDRGTDLMDDDEKEEMAQWLERCHD